MSWKNIKIFLFLFLIILIWIMGFSNPIKSFFLEYISFNYFFILIIFIVILTVIYIILKLLSQKWKNSNYNIISSNYRHNNIWLIGLFDWWDKNWDWWTLWNDFLSWWGDFWGWWDWWGD